MRTSTLLCTFALCVVLVSSGLVVHESDMDKVKDDLEKSDVRNAYLISFSIEHIGNIKSTDSIYIRYLDNDDIRPVTITGSGPYTYDFSGSYLDIGLGESRSDFNHTSNRTSFAIYDQKTHELLATVSMTDLILQNFPNTSSLNEFHLWPTYVTEVIQSVDGLTVSYMLKYEGVLDVFGHRVDWPLWKFITVFASIVVSFSFFIALLDWCCQPLHRASTMSKAGILFGNFFWLLFGGFIVGMSYLFAGLILILTCILSPFGIKLVQIGVFALLPFGREIRCDDERNHHHTCSTIGNILWVILIGFPIILSHLILGIVLTILIVTFPFALQHFKLAKIALMPFGHSVVFKENLGRGDPQERLPLYHNNGGQEVRYA